jgi:predicted kinase
VLDATFGRVAERAAVRRLAARTGARLVVFHCRAAEATLRERLTARAGDSGVVSDARLEDWPALRAAYVEPAELAGVVAVDTTAPPADVVGRALAALRA